MSPIGPFIRHHARHWFFRGLAVLLPSVLTFWLLVAGYQFLQGRIAEPISNLLREATIRYTAWPHISDAQLNDQHRLVLDDRGRRRVYQALPPERRHQWLVNQARREHLNDFWQTWSLALSFLGLVIAIATIYAAGLLLGNFAGRRLYARGEALVRQVPLIGSLYPPIRQVTDFLVGTDVDADEFSRIVAVQYPRRDIWCVGLATGGTLASIERAAGQRCVSIFIPSAPLPFTGYIINAPVADVLELPINIEDTAKFLLSGGVLVPPTQLIERQGQWLLRDATGKELPLDDPPQPHS